MSPTEFEDFLQKVAEALEFTSLKPDDKGACLLLIQKSQIALLLEYDDNLVPHTILISSEVSPIPPNLFDTVAEEALKENTLSELSLSVKPDDNTLYVHRRLHPDMEPTAIKELLEYMTSQIEKWRQKISSLEQNPPQTLKHPSPTPTLKFPKV